MASATETSRIDRHALGSTTGLGERGVERRPEAVVVLRLTGPGIAEARRTPHAERARAGDDDPGRRLRGRERVGVLEPVEGPVEVDRPARRRAAAAPSTASSRCAPRMRSSGNAMP